jgi:hypothetical protein
MHPEVKNIGFLIWLYAGNTYLLILNTPFLVLMITLCKNKIKFIVTKLKFLSQSAGNFIFFNKYYAPLSAKRKQAPQINFINLNKSSSETLRHKFIESERLKKISIHIPKHLKPTNDIDLGYYLAGLIDGDGHFSKALQLVIVFNELDASLAYFIKNKLGYGNVYKIKNKKAVILVIANRIGLVKVLNLISGKIRSENKINQINNNILSNPYFNLINKFSLNDNEDLNNYWLSGFSDADASFQIKIINASHINKRTEIRLNFQIDQKKKELLILIKNFLGGNIYYRKSQDTFYYGSTSFGSAKNVINYFDTFHLLSSKHVNYLKWRKAYTIIQDKNHLTELGLNKIIKLKNTMNRNNSETID